MDIIFWNGTIVTMNPALPAAQAVAVKNGIILALGTDQEILPLAKPNTRLVDLHGRLMLPGFCDSHMHLLSYGYGLEKVALGGANGLDDLIALGRRFLAAHPNLSWVQGRGWNNETWPGSVMPTRKELDQISTCVPISFTRWCSHVTVTNSLALKHMGVDRNTPDPAGGG